MVKIELTGGLARPALTVGVLREFLSKYPDDMEIHAFDEDQPGAQGNVMAVRLGVRPIWVMEEKSDLLRVDGYYQVLWLEIENYTSFRYVHTCENCSGLLPPVYAPVCDCAQKDPPLTFQDCQNARRRILPEGSKTG